MVVVRVFLSLILPPALLTTVLALALAAGKMSALVGNFLEGIFGFLLFWPLGIYQYLAPEPASSWECWWNKAMAPCAGWLVVGYSLALFMLLGRFKIFK